MSRGRTPRFSSPPPVEQAPESLRWLEFRWDDLAHVRGTRSDLDRAIRSSSHGTALLADIQFHLSSGTPEEQAAARRLRRMSPAERREALRIARAWTELAPFQTVSHVLSDPSPVRRAVHLHYTSLVEDWDGPGMHPRASVRPLGIAGWSRAQQEELLLRLEQVARLHPDGGTLRVHALNAPDKPMGGWIRASIGGALPGGELSETPEGMPMSRSLLRIGDTPVCVEVVDVPSGREDPQGDDADVPEMRAGAPVGLCATPLEDVPLGQSRCVHRWGVHRAYVFLPARHMECSVCHATGATILEHRFPEGNREIPDEVEYLRCTQAMDVIRGVRPCASLDELMRRDGLWEPPYRTGFQPRPSLDDILAEED